jgi:Rieske 2Fe-2S family protein
MLIYPDHGVLYNFIPRGLHDTDLHMHWFVRADAVEGEDYAKEDVVWLWHHTTLEDEYIITRNAEGALSRFYEPGPLHPEFEHIQSQFLRWVLNTIDNTPHAQSHILPKSLLTE